MPRYWVIAPTESKPQELFDKVWQFDLANNVVSIGWSDLGDVSEKNRDELAAAVAAAYPDKPPATRALYVNMIWAFFHEIEPGDVVIARKGRKTLAAVGTVVGCAADRPGTNPAVKHRSFLPVSWHQAPRGKVFADVVFPMRTVAELTEEEYRELLEEDTKAFVLEKYLQEFIVSNFDAIFQGKLKIYEDEDSDGDQYMTDIGVIDILAVEPHSQSFVVIELKKGRPSDQVIGQVLRYMGWVKKNLCVDGQAVKGLIICREPDPKLSFALEVTENVSVRYYSVSFKLSEQMHQVATAAS